MHPVPETWVLVGAGVQHTSQITIFGAMLKKGNEGGRCFNFNDFNDGLTVDGGRAPSVAMVAMVGHGVHNLVAVACGQKRSVNQRVLHQRAVWPIPA